nr:4Fe-4S binding protein [uncultured Desulfobulbus sp.]
MPLIWLKRHLRRARIGASLCICLGISLFFLFGSWQKPSWPAETLLTIQFVPSLIQAIQGALLGASYVLLILGLSLLLGRVYCSWICPLGTMQDILYSLGNPTPGYHPPHNLIRGLMLVLVTLPFLLGSSLAVSLLDPYSTFGRILSNIVRPLLTPLTNSIAWILEQFGVYILARAPWPATTFFSVVFSSFVLLGITWLAVRHGRLYCNSLCPVGTLLGLFSTKALLRLRLNKKSCIHCGRCVNVCKANCIDLARQQIDASRCVACYNCLAVCPTDSIVFQQGMKRATSLGEKKQGPNLYRRALLSQFGVTLLFVCDLPAGAVPLPLASRPTSKAEQRTCPVAPPGAQGIDHFTSTCTACHLCVSGCPSQILLPSLFAYGVSGFLQPQMSFDQGHCTHECTLCGELCPTGAIIPLSVAAKKLTQVGKAHFIKENCVVFTDNTTCGACSEHCPTKAVSMIPYANPLNKMLVIPEVNTALCIGCGGCEHACPTRPYRAIYVDGLAVHQKAQPPKVLQIQQAVDGTEDFPF